eukprot:TRINITY_DN73860_c0_g1_i1.p1 TRINITY_DN73860_c0_g1~~TRINITY_DN73860_c0_g1_i1.p1  ORF type:complete len:1051 (-),score=212.36 TRINITY_DN73860_c0_g1_i1:79-3231(-)
MDELLKLSGNNSNMTWAACRVVLKILQELLSPMEEIEELWEKSIASSKVCAANSDTGKLNVTFATEKATLLCPYSYGSASGLSGSKLRKFDDAQVPEIDPLMLVTMLLYHPEASMRLEALKLGCQILRDRNGILQDAYRMHTKEEMHLQKAMGYQFSSFRLAFQKAMTTNTDIDMMKGMLKLIQQLCEGHNSDLQDFLGENYTADKQDIFSMIFIDEDGDDGKEEEEEDSDGGFRAPNNVVQWTSEMIQMVLDTMIGAQAWQASMSGRERQYILVQQLFDTAAELIQGPNLQNQTLLRNAGVCMNVNRLWLIARIDEIEFRGLIQDNEDLADSWMELLMAMRLAEISALRFLHSLLEEAPLDQDSPDFVEMQEAVVVSKTTTIKRMVEEMKPKTICDKIITFWNLSPEVLDDDPRFDAEPVFDDDDDDAATDKHNTAVRVFRPKREKECSFYTLEEQKEHCLEICAFTYALFHAVYNAPEVKTQLFKEISIDRPDPVPGLPKPEIYQWSQWSTAKTKIFDRFTERVKEIHNEKYLHFLFGKIEIVRGSRLQTVFFFVPPAIRKLKNHQLIHKWQESCLMKVDRSSPEAQIDEFADIVNSEYISFVQHQYFLLQKPWPINQAGEVISFCVTSTMITTSILNLVMLMVYNGAYSKHSMDLSIHYQSHLSVYILTFIAGIHFLLSIIWLFFYILSYSSWIIETKVDEWKEENPRSVNELNSFHFRLYMQASIFFRDPQLLYTLFLLACSYLGLSVNFLFNAVNTIDLCMRIQILYKVIESITGSAQTVFGTMVLGFCMQFIFAAIGFMTFGHGYGFADMDTSQCSTLVECLRAHFDYGFRSAPVWNSPKLTTTRFLFDYSYNLLVILIMAAIISGIIIDEFANLRDTQKGVEDAMQSQCFICSLSKSELERNGVKFEQHILEDHYMWSYARFLLYIEETGNQELSGPEDFVKELIKQNNNGFFPIGCCIAMEAPGSGEAHMERPVRVKDMDGVKKDMQLVANNTRDIQMSNQMFKSDLKDLREMVQSSTSKIVSLQQLLTADEDQDKKKMRKK